MQNEGASLSALKINISMFKMYPSYPLFKHSEQVVSQQMFRVT